MAFADILHRASWRGVPFALELGSGRYGRRKVRHDYPYRDEVWLEDQGKLPREFRLTGFIVGDSAVYGGGDVIGQIKRMERAAEQVGAGLLVHPTRGHITVELLDLVITERWDEGNVAELQFSFVQGGKQQFPTLGPNRGGLVGLAAGRVDRAGLSAFTTRLAGPLKNGLDAVTAVAATAREWTDKIRTLSRDATSLYGTVSQLGGADFGRFFNGRNSGFLSGLVSPYAGAGSVGDLIALGSSLRATVASAADLVGARIGSLGTASDPVAIAASAQSVVAALQASAADPQDGVRILAALADFAPTGAMARTLGGEAASDLFRRASAAAIARVSATYAPASADDAHAVRARVLGPIEIAIARAGETGADEVFSTLRDLRKAVVDDLGARGGSLARLETLDLAAPRPSVVIAQQRYLDAGREAELVTQAVPIHPFFMPTRFKALSA